MDFGVIALAWAVAVGLVVLDLTRKVELSRPIVLAFLLPVLLNMQLLSYFLQLVLQSPSRLVRFAAMAPILLLALYAFARLQVWPVRDGFVAGARMNVMLAGRVLCIAGLIGLFEEALLLWLLWYAGIPLPLYILNAVFAAVYLFVFFANGVLRMMFTSRRLSIVYRVLLLLTAWVPVVNLLVLRKACRLVKEEYNFAVEKAQLRSLRVQSDMCRTRYPLVMVHGVLFRDLRYFNYWGRVPKELMRLGAHVYYGNQEAVGTIAANGADLRARVLEIVQQTGCGKVNIIAHSKGGLDSRYAITALGLAPHVASLTTISTPHRGCKFVDKACNLPEGLYRFVAARFDNTFRRMGDKQPDFYTATHQFATKASEEFNAEVPDVPGVYYQSYATKMRGAMSDPLLCIPYSMIKPLEGDNDGLVAIESAKWGEFRGVLQAPGRRGISHGDIIDLKREDIKGFDVVEAYVSIVTELKAKGY